MVIIKGKAVSDGVAIGRIVFFSKEKISVSPAHTDEPLSELERYKVAVANAQNDLTMLAQKAEESAGKEAAEIFEIHKMMLSDKDYTDEIKRMITDEKWICEYAIEQTSKKFSEIFLKMDNEYMNGRASDVLDISERMIRILTNKSDNFQQISSDDEKVIICAEDLAPSETVRLDKSKVIAFATRYGSAQSHTAILAGTMNIPAIIGLGEALSEDYDGMLAIADGSSGNLYIDPTPDILEEARERRRQSRLRRERLQKLRGMDNITIDGYRVMVYSNIGTPEDVQSAIDNDAGGIGLFRSEFLYLGKKTYPTEEEQYLAYKKVLRKMGDKKVVVRTLDIGADKCAEYFNLEQEENPAMGYRAIRICLTQTDIFKTQLRALLRASAFGKLSIMIPMVTSISEVRQTRKIMNEVKTELRAKGIDFDEAVEFGIMIETPAAVMISDILAREVDFFSIGTNDLTQYCLAIDRQNQRLEPYYDAQHTGVLRMIYKTIKNAHRARIWCGICGELAADLEVTEMLLSMGIDELSVSPSFVLPLREKIRSVNLDAIRDDCLGSL